MPFVVSSIVEEARKGGIGLFLRDGKLFYRCKSGKYGPGLRERIRIHKEEIISHLEKESAGSGPEDLGTRQERIAQCVSKFAEDIAKRYKPGFLDRAGEEFTGALREHEEELHRAYLQGDTETARELLHKMDKLYCAALEEELARDLSVAEHILKELREFGLEFWDGEEEDGRVRLRFKYPEFESIEGKKDLFKFIKRNEEKILAVLYRERGEEYIPQGRSSDVPITWSNVPEERDMAEVREALERARRDPSYPRTRFKKGDRSRGELLSESKRDTPEKEQRQEENPVSLESLMERARKDDGSSKWWQPENEGDMVGGALRGVKRIKGKFGEVLTLKIEQKNGEIILVSCGKVIEQEIKEQGAKVGDNIAIKYLGKPDGKRYKAFVVHIEHTGDESKHQEEEDEDVPRPIDDDTEEVEVAF